MDSGDVLGSLITRVILLHVLMGSNFGSNCHENEVSHFGSTAL